MLSLTQAREKAAAALRAPIHSEWSPPWCSHVRGYFEERVLYPEPEPQRYVVICEQCGDEHRGACATGAVRNHVAHFASVHTHRDPFGPG